MHQEGQLSAGSLVRRWFRMLLGLTIGSVTGMAGLAAAAVDVGVVRLTEYELGRIARFDQAVHTNPLTRRGCRRYLAVRWLVGALGAGVIYMLAFWYVVAVSMVTAWLSGGDWGFIEEDDRVSLGLILLVTVPGVLVIFVTTVGVAGVAVLERWLATALLGTSQQTLLRQRVAELTSTRAEVIEAIDDERRRIERDLHDGVQQRLVALGMLIGRAKRAKSEGHLHALLQQAHDTAGEAIDELREVATRVYPAVLDDSGLARALEALAERASVRVDIRNELTESPGKALEAVIYFVASEAVTNAAKHADPSVVEISVWSSRSEVAVRVQDDGVGGADPTGSGLSGLDRRVKAVDGALDVLSPAGGPTVISARLPCA
ncbi:histidine kinase [Lentzea sp. NBRC 102530]|uniref:sensor histidine kinase n=1 Tax=Lentzea sp. NBRC 102530 TaxID=3032201 RepID=UPI0025549296|nr:histidine kinase [Lentzea sp. NBRC 102530]